MGVRYPSQASNAVSNALPASAVETVVCTLPPLNISFDFSQIFLAWMLAITAGTGTTAFQVKIRRGTTITGAALGGGNWTFTTVAGNNVILSGNYFDTPGAVAGQQYALTVVQQGATVAGTLLDQAILAFAL